MAWSSPGSSISDIQSQNELPTQSQEHEAVEVQELGFPTQLQQHEVESWNEPGLSMPHQQHETHREFYLPTESQSQQYGAEAHIAPVLPPTSRQHHESAEAQEELGLSTQCQQYEAVEAQNESELPTSLQQHELGSPIPSQQHEAVEAQGIPGLPTPHPYFGEPEAQHTIQPRQPATAAERTEDFSRDVERLGNTQGGAGVIVSPGNINVVHQNQGGGGTIYTNEANIRHDHHNKFSTRNVQKNYSTTVINQNLWRENHGALEQSKEAIQENADLFVETSSYHLAVDHLRYNGGLVICGPPRCGKSTLARAILRHFDNQQFEPLVLHSFEEWRTLVGNVKKKQIVLLEHIFGHSLTNKLLPHDWCNVLKSVRGLFSRSDFPVFTVVVLENHIVSQLKSRANDVLSSCVILDLGLQDLNAHEKEEMIRKHLKAPIKTEIETEINRALELDRSGPVFPWCCSKFLTGTATNRYDASVFAWPALAYVEHIQNFLHVKEDKERMITMIADTMVQLKTLDTDFQNKRLLGGNIPKFRLNALKLNDIGSFVLNNASVFPCRVLYDALGLALGRSCALAELLMVCDTRFLMEHVHTEEMATFHSVSVCIDRKSYDWNFFVDRIVDHIHAGHLAEICQHPSLQDDTVLSELERFCEKKSCSVELLTTAIDPLHNVPLMYWSLFTAKRKLTSWCFKYLEEDTSKGSFSVEDLTPKILFANCLFNVDRESRFGIQALILQIPGIVTLLSTNRENRVMELPVPLINERITVQMKQNVRDMMGKAFYKDIPEELLKIEVEENVWKLSSPCSRYNLLRLLTDDSLNKSDQDGNTLLQLAVKARDLQLVKFLLSRGAPFVPADADGKSCLLIAYQKDYQDIAQHIFHQRPQIVEMCGNTDRVYSTLKNTLIQNMKHWFVDLFSQSCFSENDSFSLLEMAVKDHDLRLLEIFASARNLNINATDGEQQTTLHKACRAADQKIVLQLLQGGSNPDLVDNNGQSPLHLAAKHNRRDFVNILIEHGTNPYLQDKDGYTALHSACISDSVEGTIALIQNKAEVNAADKEGKTPLHHAVIHGNINCVNELLRSAADANQEDYSKQTPLHIACQSDFPEIVEVLVRYFAKLHVANFAGKSPLHLAAEKGHYTIGSFLVKHGAKLDTLCQEGNTPLHASCLNGFVQFTELLLQSGAPVNAVNTKGITPLLNACAYGHTSIVLSLLRWKANLQQSDSHGNTPLHAACKQGSTETVELLLEKGASVDVRTKDLQETPLHAACRCGSAAVVDLLKTKGADINCEDKKGNTPLHVACSNGHDQVVKVLLKYKDIQLEKESVQKKTPLMETIEQGSESIMTVLLEAGADASSSNTDGFTPLHYAVTKGCERLVQQLLKKLAIDGIDCTAKDGITPLHIAAKHGNANIVQQLLAHNASMNCYSPDHGTPLHLACLHGHEKILDMLLSHQNSLSRANKSKTYTDAFERVISDAGLNAKTSEGETPLHLACKIGSLTMASSLCQHGAAVNIADVKQRTPLHYACWSGSQELVTFLLDRGATQNARGSRVESVCDDPLTLFVSSGVFHENIVVTIKQRCFHQGAVVASLPIWLNYVPIKTCSESEMEQRPSDFFRTSWFSKDLYFAFYTPLHQVCSSGNESLAELLLGRGASVNSSHREGNETTPLMVACANGQTEVAKLLLRKGADINAKDATFCSALHFACFPGLLGLTLKGFCQVKETAWEINGIPFTQPLKYSTCCQQDVVCTLVQHGAGVNDKDNLERTALHYACMNNPNELHKVEDEWCHPEYENMKDKEYHKLNVPYNYEKQCLRNSHMRRYLDDAVGVISHLLEKEALIDAQDEDGNTPLHLACEAGFQSATELLLKHKSFLVHIENNSGETPLHVACQHGALGVVRILLENKAHIQAKCRKGLTPLHVAVEYKSRECVQLLIDKGADVNAETHEKQTPLGLACLAGSADIVEVLVRSGVEINKPDTEGNTYLHKACLEGKDNLANTLIQNFAQLNAQNKQGFTPLHYAALNGHSKVVDLTLDHGAVIDCTNKDGRTPLHLACQKNENKSAVETLLTRGAHSESKDKKGNTPILIAGAFGAADIVFFLLEAGACKCVKNNQRMTLLHFACSHGDVRLAERLLDSGAVVNARTKKGASPFFFACQFGHIEIIQKLYQMGAKVDCARVDGMTPLHAACKAGQLEVVENLLESNTDVNVEDHAGRSALHYAAEGGYVDVVTYLVRCGGNVRVCDDSGRSLLHMACAHNHVDVVMFLIENDVDIDCYTDFLQTPLHFAVKNNHQEVTQVLLNFKANVNTLDKYGWAPIHFACMNNNQDIAKLLFDNGSRLDFPWSPLHVACLCKNIECISFLLDAGADLSMSIDWDAEEEEEFVLEQNLHIGENNSGTIQQFGIMKQVLGYGRRGKNPFHLACIIGDVSVLKLLHKRASNEMLNRADADGMTPLHLACKYGSLPSCIEAVVVDLEYRDYLGRTPLHYSCICGNMKSVRILLGKGACVNKRDCSGRTAIHYACEKGHVNIVGTLLGHFASFSKDSRGNDPLHLAIKNGHSEVERVVKDCRIPRTVACNREKFVKLMFLFLVFLIVFLLHPEMIAFICAWSCIVNTVLVSELFK